ncbi:MAG TPA: CHAD domain-containing protein [Thermoplasmata archaeon]|nr:CHAD domain-containing protein [Thermoplasmata archaeon]
MASDRARTVPGLAGLLRDVRRSLAAVRGELEALATRPHATPESLHDLHRALRRLRQALALWARLLGPADRRALRPLDRRVARLARLIGRVRDRDVMLGLIESANLPRPSADDLPRLLRLRARLRDDARTGRELLKVFARSEIDGRLAEHLETLLRRPARADRVPSVRRLLEDEDERRRLRVRAAHRRARRKSSVNRLHRLRLQIRRLRHLDELRARLDPAFPVPNATAVRRLQAQLGRLHDLDIVLTGLDADLRGSRWAEAMREERRALRAGLRRVLRARDWPWRRGSRRTARGPRRSPAASS